MTSTAPPRAPEASAQEPKQESREDQRGPRSGFAWLLALPGNAISGVKRAAAATPGRLSLITTGLVVLSLVTGLVGAVAIQDRENTLSGLLDHREPLAAAAQQVYRSLSDADATAASAFLSTGDEPAALRERYNVDIAQAGAALAKAGSDSAEVPAAAEQVDIISRQLPVYTGLVEKARASNRQGFPIGAAYLREASELMRAEILPAAHRLYEIDTERLRAEQDDATGVPWVTGLLVLGLLAALIATQVYLRRKTNRVFNIGLLVSTIAVGLAILWTASALTVQAVLVDNGRSDGTEQVDLLVRARINALQARADETLTLVARGGSEQYEEEFAELSGRLGGDDGSGGLLGQARENAPEEGPSRDAIDSAIENAGTWLAAHEKVRESDVAGDYQAAVEQAINVQDPRSAGAAFTRLDRNLADAINVGRQNFVDETTNGSRALTLLTLGFAVLAVVAALGATLGIRERLREYR